MKTQIVRVQRWGEQDLVLVDDNDEAHLQPANPIIAAGLAEDNQGWFEGWRPAPDRDWHLGRRIDRVADDIEAEIIAASARAEAGRWQIRWCLLIEIMLTLIGWTVAWWLTWVLIGKWTGHG